MLRAAEYVDEVGMKNNPLKSERTRLILTLELAVVLPAAALVILGAMHLRSIQRDRGVEAAIQRDFNQVLAISEKEFNKRAYDLADDAKASFPPADTACGPSLDRVLASHPYLAHVFFYDPDHGLIFRSQSYRANDGPFQMEADDLHKMIDGWTKVEYEGWTHEISQAESKGMPYMFFMNAAPRGESSSWRSRSRRSWKRRALESRRLRAWHLMPTTSATNFCRKR